MAYTTIDDPSAHFQTDLFTGDGSGQSLTFDGNSDLQPDWIWGSLRDEDGGARFVFDSSRGATKRLKTNLDTEEQTRSGVTTFDTDGYAMGSHTDSNKSSEPIVVWAWKANGGTTASNSDGSITSTVQANTTAGFSIITFTGNGSNNTFGHGLGATPDIYFLKRRDDTGNWLGYHTLVDGSFDYIRLNLTNANASSGLTAPTSSVITFNTAGDFVGYCFKSIQGYSKIGTYTGNANADGPFVYTGFKPAWLMIKRTDAENSWYILDSTRGSTNPVSAELESNTTGVEATSNVRLDILSNGFKIRTSGAAYNASGGTYIYMAFAEHPFVSSKGVPVTAR